MKLSIIVPAYNEEDRLGPVLSRYLDYFSAAYGEAFEIIIVVNGSVDGTGALAREFASQWKQVVVIEDPRPIGKGGAVMKGFAAAKGDLVGFVDADGSTEPDAYMDLIEHRGDADLIMASRWLPGAVVEPRQPLARRVASRVFNRLVRWFFRVKITDTQCGAKIMTREAVKKVLPHIGVTRWAFDVDLLFQTRRQGLIIRERATVWQDAAGSRLNIPRASTEMFIAICRLRLLYSPLSFIVTIYDVTLGRLLHRK